MGEAIVSFVVRETALFLVKEKKKLGTVGEDVESINHELDHMRAFLRKAEVIEAPVGSQLSVWVADVRKIAFDIEDTLDEFTLHLRSDQRGTARMCRFIKNLKYRRGVASQMKRLKARVEEASKQRERYTSDIPEHVERFAAISSNVSEQRSNALLLDEDELVGIDEPKRQLIDWLVGADSELKVIAVVGMGGLGKTTLAKKVYDDYAVQKHFKNQAWVIVSQFLKMDELLKDIIYQIFGESKQQTPQGMERMKSHDLKGIIKNFLRESKFLLVLDDIWRVDVWDEIKYALPNSKQGSRVIITTRRNEVANASCSDFKGEVYHLEPLSSELSWQLFCTKTFQGHQCPYYLNDIAHNIVEKCQGLPLAIVAISGVLAPKKNGSPDEWDMVSRNLTSEFENKLNVKGILSLSYNDLPFHLKACVLHISTLPEDCKINRLVAAKLWIAEGFVEEKEGKTLEEVAESYFFELVDRNLIIIDDPLKIEWRVHDLLREVILSKAKDQNFAVVINEKNSRWPESARRSIVQNTLGNVSDNKQLCKLRSLLVFGVNDFPLSSFAGDLRLVKVIDLTGANIEIFPNEITKLYHLRYLNLKQTNVRDIPSSIGSLQNMQYLNIGQTFVTSLPHTILKLRQLRHLIVHTYRQQAQGCGLAGFPGIGSLTSLQSLFSIEVNVKGGIDVIHDLGKLTQLRTVGIMKLKKEYGPALCSSLEKLKSLEDLGVQSQDAEEIVDVQSISAPPKFLKRLALNGRLDKLPGWIQSLHSLSALILEESQLRNNIIEAVQDLPSLSFFYLDNAVQGGELCFKAEGFQKLKILEFRNLQALQRVEVQKGSMPGLEALAIKNSPSLENVPFGVEHLSKLRKLEFFHVSNQFINRISRVTGGGEDFWRLEHIPRVGVYSFKDGQLFQHPL